MKHESLDQTSVCKGRLPLQTLAMGLKTPEFKD